ncbi:hypothetical protein STEG23_019623, partial [Scotinomys teguina]
MPYEKPPCSSFQPLPSVIPTWYLACEIAYESTARQIGYQQKRLVEAAEEAHLKHEFDADLQNLKE